MKKINKAVFRGSATGCYTTKDKNKRLKLYEISKNRDDMDIGITKGLRDQLENERILLVEHMTQCNF